MEMQLFRKLILKSNFEKSTNLKTVNSYPQTRL